MAHESRSNEAGPRIGLQVSCSLSPSDTLETLSLDSSPCSFIQSLDPCLVMTAPLAGRVAIVTSSSNESPSRSVVVTATDAGRDQTPEFKSRTGLPGEEQGEGEGNGEVGFIGVVGGRVKT